MPTNAKHPVALLLLAYLAFISVGLPDGLLGVAWPSIRTTFDVPLDALGALLISTTAGYVTSSFISGPILTRMNVGMLLALSAGATATSLFAYTLAPSWAVMVAFGSLAGLGAGAIDAGLNTYAAQHYSARTLNMLHAFYGLGATAGPIIMTSVLMASLPWQRGYAIVAGAQMALALCFLATRSLWPSGASLPELPEPVAVGVSSTLRLPAAWLGIAAFLVYVGIEAGAGAWAYTFLREGRGFSLSAAGSSVTFFWGGLMSGRVVFGLLPSTRCPGTLLRACIGVAVIAAGILSVDLGETASLIALGVLGFACGPIFPSLISMTPARVGAPHTPNTVGFQVAAAAFGGSMLPALIGVIAHHVGLQIIPVCLLTMGALLFVICELIAVVPSATKSNRLGMLTP